MCEIHSVSETSAAGVLSHAIEEWATCLTEGSIDREWMHSFNALHGKCVMPRLHRLFVVSVFDAKMDKGRSLEFAKSTFEAKNNVPLLIDAMVMSDARAIP